MHLHLHLHTHTHTHHTAEISHGLLSLEDERNQFLWFRRTITNLSQCKGDVTSGAAYADVVTHKDADTLVLHEDKAKALKKLKEDTLVNILDDKGMFEYTVQWAKGGFDPEKVADHKHYISKLCADVEESVRALVQRGYIFKGRCDW
jgi:hypothetical protein